jgi:phage shock protein PspC (stress-responsive transcriptional regulator)
MQNVQPSLFARDHTFLGVCEGLGEDFGFNPLFLRMALPVPLFFFPAETIAGYLAAGVVVLLSRLVFPDPRAADADQAGLEPRPQPAVIQGPAAADVREKAMPLAA